MKWDRPGFILTPSVQIWVNNLLLINSIKFIKKHQTSADENLELH